MTKLLKINKHILALILFIRVGSIGLIFAKFDKNVIDSVCDKAETTIQIENYLKIYTMETLSGDSISLDNNQLNDLFRSESFIRMAQVLLNDTVLNHLPDNWYTKDYFEVYRFNYLFNCTDKCTLYTIAERLLREDNINGMLGLWNNCEILHLPSYKTVRDKVIESYDPYRHAILTTIMFNSHNIKEYEYLRVTMESKYSSDSAIAHLLGVLDNTTAISLYDFMYILDSY